VLEGVTLAQVVELVVKVLVNLAGSAVLDKETAEDTQTAHPHDLTVRGVSDVSFAAQVFSLWSSLSLLCEKRSYLAVWYPDCMRLLRYFPPLVLASRF
jgi:hypothetical protein